MSVVDTWNVVEENFDPEQLHFKETVFTIGNGYVCTRGAFEEGYPGGNPGTFMHGLYDDVPLLLTELANAPNWLPVDISFERERFSLAEGKILSYQRSLDLRTGLLSRRVRWQSPTNLTVDVHFERFANLAHPHIVALRVKITPVDFGAEIRVTCGLNGYAANNGYLHWGWIDQGLTDTKGYLLTHTRASGLKLGAAMRLNVQGASVLNREQWDVSNQPTLVAVSEVPQGEILVVEKVVTLYTSRDVEDPIGAAQKELEQIPTPGWDHLWESNAGAWEAFWDVSDVLIEGDEAAQLAIRYSLFQLRIAAPAEDEHASIGAKTLSGFGYRGHVFWDVEVFMLPFFTFVHPDVARNMLSYRFHALPEARKKAQRHGYEGAQYPWESAATGEEVAPTWVPHFKDRKSLVRIWTGDIQIHPSADIVFAVWQYWRLTGDDDFILNRGAEIIFSTADFWASRAEWNAENECYEFTQVMGPDEYHHHVDNNAFTNNMAAWNLRAASDLHRWLQQEHPQILTQVFERADLSVDKVRAWQRVAEKILLPFDETSGLIEQFEGYFDLKDVNLADYEPRDEAMISIFGIDGITGTQVIKQPDVLMLLYLLEDQFDEDTVRVNFQYYDPRTDHTYGSSLGPAVQAIMSCRVGDIEAAYEHFQRAAFVDLHDLRGNTKDGIHGATAGGVWQSLVFGFAGLRVDEQGWSMNPQLPSHWHRLAFKFFWRGELQEVDIRA
jgi:kojibiose phosphorylase